MTWRNGVLDDVKQADVVSTANEQDICYWCNRFSVSRVLLMEVIARAGTKAPDIERYLRFRDR